MGALHPTSQHGGGPVVSGYSRGRGAISIKTCRFPPERNDKEDASRVERLEWTAGRSGILKREEGGGKGGGWKTGTQPTSFFFFLSVCLSFPPLFLFFPLLENSERERGKTAARARALFLSLSISLSSLSLSPSLSLCPSLRKLDFRLVPTPPCPFLCSWSPGLKAGWGGACS